MTVLTEMQFPVTVAWDGGRLTTASARDKDMLEIATPSEFATGLAGYWSPEDLLVTAVASCYALTLASVAERRRAPLVEATITATGHMSHRDDGRFGFTVIEVDAHLKAAAGGEDAVRAVATAAAERCLVTQALDVPVHVAVDITPLVPEATAVRRRILRRRIRQPSRARAPWRLTILDRRTADPKAQTLAPSWEQGRAQRRTRPRQPG